MELKRDGLNRYRLPRHGKMRVDAVVYVNEHLLPYLREDKSLEQLMHAACLPGVVEPVIGMPDIHEGFGLPIGGVMAVAPDGVISCGAVGMDINCGVRLIRSDLLARDFDKPLLRRLMERIEDYVPTGVGKKGKHKGLTAHIFEDVAHRGVQAVIEAGFGAPGHLEYIEEEGCLPGADIAAVSREACARGSVQLGTLGGGNHFIEIQEVTDVYDPELAARFGLFRGQLTVMIHTGSRGFGHQICTDYTKRLAAVAPKYGIELPSKGLAAAPIDSREGQDYYKAMACAVNFAFANRQIIMTDVVRAFGDVLGFSAEAIGMRPVYDVAHNIAKWEKHYGRRLLVHRKGATRALCAGHPANPPVYRDTGHPAVVPGSMGTASYVLVGTEKAAETFFSVNHGAGRLLSRTAAEKKITREEFERAMGEVLYNTRNYREVVDEAPLAYKDIEQVVETLVAVGITKKVVRMRPLAVIKGKD
ncbi:tRNA-splicing ligase RtcB [Thermodesulfitimonas autotrophica]|uniref:tRNA-splicing ligase RtcB n=1 Tax=Thermodesulfitimonas autotrophica TaxID=1894989 RepID=A0A3N5ADP5_9THEO|nr:RtcB family protein [Thermodesulfitimonas autotrophica]RPF42683.1 tRNA-splicing ligase RtcB [Thermodesulfitimonas autotrophica]